MAQVLLLRASRDHNVKCSYHYLKCLSRHRPDLLPIVQNGWKPKMATPAGPSRMQIVPMQTCSTDSTQYWVKVVQIVGHKSDQLIFTVWPLERGVLCKIQISWSLLLRAFCGRIDPSAITRVNHMIALS